MQQQSKNRNTSNTSAGRFDTFLNTRLLFGICRFTILCCAFFALTSCSTLQPAGLPDPQNEPITIVDPPDAPEEVVKAFLDAWNNKDLETMYGFVSRRSQEIYPFQIFQNRYDAANNAMDLVRINYIVGKAQLQGVTAAVPYDVTLVSNTFNEIADPNRTIRLVQENDQWRIAWSTLDILDGLSSDSRITVETSFPPRASIYDRNGNVLVEQNGTIVVLYAIQQDMSNVEDCIVLLGRILNRSQRNLRRLFASYVPETYFHVGETDLDTYTNNRADLENICGMFQTESAFSKVSQYETRRYIGHGAATHVTGYIGRVPADELNLWLSRGYRESDLVGIHGIERAYEEQLAGKPQRFLRIVEPGGATIRELNSAEGVESRSVTLTIDRDLQIATSHALNDAFNYAEINWASVATGGAAVVLDVNTGEILAMASYPTFDPGIFNPNTSYDALTIIGELNADSRKPYTNKTIMEQYSPGSVYKIITTLAAAGEGIWTRESTFKCELEWQGREKYGDVLDVRYDWRYTDGLDAAGDIGIVQALASSCDPFYYETGALLFRRNPNLLVHYSEELGLGRRTGIELPEPEAAGNLASPSSMGEAINNAIGQGNVSTTPLQMAMMVSAVANGGTVYQPFLVQKVGGTDGQSLVSEKQPQVLRELGVSSDVIEIVHDGMCSVTTDEDFGTAVRSFGNAPYSVCGKTGTAQAGFAPNAWFVAFAPRENPQIAVVVAVPNSREGSEVAAPITRRIMDFYFNTDVAPFPDWWEGEYVPLPPPGEGQVAGG